MVQLLREELKQRGFEEKGSCLVRRKNGVTVTVDATTGTVTAEAETTHQAALEGEKHGRVYDDVGPTRPRWRRSCASS